VAEVVRLPERINPLKAPAGTKLALMGNEAIARGAVESGIYVVTGYPGTPSSEVIMTLQRFGKDLDIYVEWAVNEKVAFELALGASIGGARSLVTMKAPGVNIASDPILSAAYCGVDGALVMLVADDPGPITTQTEQDDRWFSKLAKLPTITPSNPQEAKDYVKVAVALSEKLQLPVILRTTTRVNHTVGDVVLGAAELPRKFKGFKRNPPRFVRAGMRWNLERHKWLNKQLGRVEEVLDELGASVNEVHGDGDVCVVTEGVTYNYVAEALNLLDLREGMRVLKVGQLYPPPKKFLKRGLRGCRKVVVVEELDPYLEEMVKALLYDEGVRVEIHGKHDSLLPMEGELNVLMVAKAISRVTGIPLPTSLQVNRETPAVPPRPPPLCPGCPHRASYIAILKGISKAGFRRDEVPIFGDIGCYALSVESPLNAIWTEHSMGASISMAAGMKLGGYDKPVIATIGDSTFFHSGIPALLEAVHKRINVLVVILDNTVVAMTGHQSTPSWSVTETGRKAKPVLLEDIVKALGVDNLAVIDPFDIDSMANVVAQYLRKPGVNVIIARAPCALMKVRAEGVKAVCRVDPEACIGCMACIRGTGCPAMYVDESGKAAIIEEDCTGCGLCAYFCPRNAIKEVRHE